MTVAITASSTETKARNTLLFLLGSVGSNMANQLSLKQITRTTMNVTIETMRRMNIL